MTQIPAFRLQAHRQRTFRLAAELRLDSVEEALAFVKERGFVYFWPIKGADLPNLWAAVAGQRPVADAHDDPGHVTWRWKDSMLDKRQWYYAKVLRGKATMIALDVVPLFYALSENYGDPEHDYLQLYEDGLLSREAKLIYEALLREGPLDTVNLRRKIHMTGKASNSPFERGLTARLRKQAVIGMPKYDLDQVIRSKSRENANIAQNNPEAINLSIAEHTLKQYALREVFGDEVAEAHMLGKIHIHDLGYPTRVYCSSHSLEYLKKYGLNMQNLDTSSAPARHARTLTGHLVTIPNEKLVNSTVENIAKRPHIRWLTNIGITYDTPPEKVEEAVTILETILTDHEGLDPAYPPRVFFNGFNDWSLNIMVIAWYHPPDYWNMQSWLQRTCLEILRRFNQEGIDFAFPTQTVYLANDDARQLKLQMLTGESLTYTPT